MNYNPSSLPLLFSLLPSLSSSLPSFPFAFSPLSSFILLLTPFFSLFNSFSLHPPFSPHPLPSFSPTSLLFSLFPSFYPHSFTFSVIPLLSSLSPFSPHSLFLYPFPPPLILFSSALVSPHFLLSSYISFISYLPSLSLSFLSLYFRYVLPLDSLSPLFLLTSHFLLSPHSSVYICRSILLSLSYSIFSPPPFHLPLTPLFCRY